MKLTLKAQISIFVVISAILVIGLAFLFTMNFDGLKVWEDEKASYKVKEFVDGCLELETRKAIELIGLHGGWLYHPPMTFTQRDKPEQFNRGAKGLDFLEKAEIPYWYYYDDVDEQFMLNIPEYDSDNRYSIRNQIKLYLDENLERNCLESFRIFEDVYKIEYEPKQINTQIEFLGKDVATSLDLPLRIREINTNNSEYIDEFKVRVDNKLEIPYLMAIDIVYAESNSSFIEKRIIDFITPYQSSEGRELLPPFYDFKMTYDFQPWDLRKTEDLFMRIVSSNIGLIQFSNSDTKLNQIPAELRNSKFVQGANAMYNKDYMSTYSLTKENSPKKFKEYKNYEVRPTFLPFFPFYLQISPGMGDVILLPRPQAVIELLPFFFTEYTAVYEATLPIIFEISSNDVNDRFVFNLAIEANIDHNSPLKENKKLNIDIEELNAKLNMDKSLVCDPPQFISEYVTLNITDPLGNNRSLDDPEIGVEDALITFDCKGISTCFMGQTEINGKYIQRNITELKFRLPINCDPGKLEIYKYGYKKLVFENLNPSLDKPINLGEVYMPSAKTFEVDVNFLGASNSKFATSVRRLSDNETGFLILENKDQDDFTRVIEFDKDNQFDLTVELLPGNYSIQGFVIREKPFTIPAERFCYDKGIIFSDEECIDIPEIEMDAWVRSGIEIENFEVSLKKIVNRNKLTINMIDFGVPGSYSELESLSDVMSNLKATSEGKAPYFD